MLRRRRGSVSTPRSGPSLFGPLVLGSPRPGGQPKSQKAFWAACFCTLGSFWRAAPRAVGSRSRVGLLARPSAAVASAGVRARGSRHAAFVFGGRSHPPAARGPGKPVGGGDGSRYVWLAVEGSDCSRLVRQPSEIFRALRPVSSAIGALASLLRDKKTHREQADTSLHHQPTAL